MKKYTKEQFLKAAEIGEVSMIDAKHIVSLLDEAVSTEIKKDDSAHAAKFGISGVSGSFYSLIDRLQRHSEWKYPNRMWTIDTYYGIAFQWIDKEKELEERVLKLENDMRLAGAL